MPRRNRRHLFGGDSRTAAAAARFLQSLPARRPPSLLVWCNGVVKEQEAARADTRNGLSATPLVTAGGRGASTEFAA